jgi:hypothetical protein
LRHFAIILLVAILPSLQAAEEARTASAEGAHEHHFTAKEVFSYGQPIVFQDDFKSGQFGKWNFSEDDRYNLPKENPERIQIIDAPGLPAGRKAARFAVPRAPNSFRAEISLPSEKGFNERWYAERMLLPADWVCDPGKGNDIVMQWHAVPGNGKPTFPNLDIAVGNTTWLIRQSYGTAHNNPTRTSLKLADPATPGQWVAWVIHAKWSPGADGILQVWKDRKLVADRKGPNVYSDIGEEYTPYLKTGIYHPEWHLDTDRKREAFEQEKPVATGKAILVTDVKIGSGEATFEDVSPRP